MRIRTRQNGSVLKWALAALVVFVIIVVALFFYARKNPLAVYERMTRSALSKAGLEKKTFSSEAGMLTYWEGGKGQTLVLLHGVGDQAGAFQGIVESLLPEYRVLIPDLPGHGDSEPAEGPLPMSLVYGGLEELLASVASPGPSVVVGHSMGAWLTTIHAHRHPEAVVRAVLMNGGALIGERPDLSLTPVDREAARTLMAALRDPASPLTPDFVLDDIVENSAKGPIGRMVGELDDLVAHLLEGRLGEISVPVDLLWGESDQLMTLAYAERMASQLPSSRITTIPGCGHHAANECPEKLAEKLGEVLRMEPPALAPVDESLTEAEGVVESAPMTTADVLAHRVEGDGEPVLILNGGLMTFAAWEPVSAQLAKSHRLVLNDLRGQLLSPGKAPAAMAENVEDLVALLDHLEIESVHVLGTSYGGEVALFFAALQPERVRSLTAVTVMDYATESIWQGVEDLRLLVADALAGGDKGRLHDRVVEEVYSAAFREKYAEELAGRREVVASFPDVWFEGLEGIMAAMENLDARPYLGAIRCPTLIVIAAADEVIPPERSVALAAAIEGAETCIHETSGHALVAEDPRWLTEVCLAFLKKHATAN